jgi:hypothetical protein
MPDSSREGRVSTTCAKESAMNISSPVNLSYVQRMDLRKPCKPLQLVAPAVVDVAIREVNRVFVLVMRWQSLRKMSFVGRRVEMICARGSRG